MPIKTARDSQHVPDILDCLAQLSNDEVPTPPKLAREILDILPAHVWTDPELRWLDPVSKSGVFLREIAVRLIDGLAEWEPDLEKRRQHIFGNMLFGAAITEMTGILSRRTLYTTHDASSDLSIVRFQDPAGNLPFVPTEHDFGLPNSKGEFAKSCVVCGAPADLERGASRENYAYSFIHGTYPPPESDMKFDVIVGNPPYQIDSNGNTRTMPIYQKFIERAIALEPRYLAMIVPSRWFAGGLGLDAFRERMIADRRIAKIVDNPITSDCFPGVEIKGGVNYFLWDHKHDGDCEFSTRVGGELLSIMVRDISYGQGILLRDNRAASIVDKAGLLDSLFDTIQTGIPFGDRIRTNFADAEPEPFDGSIPLIFNSKVEYVRSDQITRNHAWIERFKVLLPKASSGEASVDVDGGLSDVVLGEPIALAPGSACTQSYIVAGTFDTRNETENYAWYLCTKFVRFLVLQRKITQDVVADRFRFVPQMDMTRRWTDEDLYEHFGLTDDERAYIEATIKPREPNLSLDSPIPASHLPGGYKYRPAK